MSPAFIANIDWDLLRKQKIALVDISPEHLTHDQEDALSGVISLIDSIQEYAIVQLGMKEEDIFIQENETQ